MEICGRPADRVLDSVLHIHHTLNLADGIANLGSQFLQQRGIGGENLDLDRLGRVGKIADHVLQYLYELNIQLRLSPLDLLAHIRHHLVDAAIPFALQLHRDVASVRLCHCRESHLQPSTPRCSFHLRRAAQDPLHVRQHAVRLRQ